MSATFDEGGVAGLLINQLRLDSDQCQLMLDASSRISSGFTSLTSIPIDASSLRSQLYYHTVVDVCVVLIYRTCAKFGHCKDLSHFGWFFIS